MNTTSAEVQAGGRFPAEYTLAATRGQMSFHLPEAVACEGNPVLVPTPAQDFPDGARFISVMRTTGVLSAPLDTYYAYVGSHDGKEIWLATAPHPLGPWVWQRCVLHLDDTSFKGHISSPSAVLHNGQVYMYFHGVMPTGQQPTALATSADGVNFKEFAFPVTSTHPNRKNHWYGQSTSYARVVKDGPLFIATFQGNGLGRNIQAGGVTTVAGMAMSEDGIRWRLSRRPLLGNTPGSRGPFAAILLQVWGRWLMLYEHKEMNTIVGAVSEGEDVAGPYEDIGTVIQSPEGIQNMGWPFPVFHDRKLYLLCGGQTSSTQGAIYAFVMDWGSTT